MTERKITILAVGRLKEAYWQEACEALQSQIRRRISLRIEEVPDERNDRRPAEQILAQEGRALMKRISPAQYVIALAIEGTPLTTEEVQHKMRSLWAEGRCDVVFVIGGSLGLSEEVQKRADFLLSFSPLTFPHQLSRVLLLEQLARIR